MIRLLIILRNMAFLFPLAFQVFLIKCRFSDSSYLLIGVGLGILVSISQSQVIWDFVCQVFSLFPLLLVIDTFKWFWMESLRKVIQAMLDFLHHPSLILHFSYHTLITFLIIYVIFLSMLMTPLSTLSEIKMMHLICGKN